MCQKVAAQSNFGDETRINLMLVGSYYGKWGSSILLLRHYDEPTFLPLPSFRVVKVYLKGILTSISPFCACTLN